MITNDVQNQYAAFKGRRDRMENLLSRSQKMVSQLSMKQYEANLAELTRKVHDDSFKIMVVGTFKNGKSTFINSLLGEEVLPAYSIPCTAVINEVKYGTEKRAILHFRNPLPEKLPTRLAKRAADHIAANKDKGPIPSLEIPYTEIEDYVVIPMGVDAAEMLLESPYEKVELFWPLELLKNGVEIVDSPGLNENETRTKVTMQYLSKADAILMVLNASSLCSATEMEFIEDDLYDQGFTEPFFIVNRFDCIPKNQQEMVRQFGTVKLQDLTTFGKEGIYYVSALDGLDGKLEKNNDKYINSGIAAFEARLSEYLIRNRGKAKLSQPAKELKRVLNEEALYKIIPMQRKLLNSSLDSVKKRYEKEKPVLTDLQIKRNQVKTKMELDIERSKMEFRRVINRNLLELIDNIPVWMNDYKPSTRIGVNPLRIKEKVSDLTKELTEYLQNQMQIHQKEWRKEVLAPLAEEKIQKIFDNVERDVEEILASIDDIQMEVSDGEAKISKVPVWERVLGLVGGLILVGPGCAIAGGINGFGKALAKTFVMEMGLAFLLGVFGMLNPIAIIAAVLGLFIFNVHEGESNTVRKVKEAVIKQAQELLVENKENNISAVLENVEARFHEIADCVVKGIDGEIRTVEEQLESIISDLEKGQEEKEKKEKALKECEETIQDIMLSLDELIFQLVDNA